MAARDHDRVDGRRIDLVGHVIDGRHGVALLPPDPRAALGADRHHLVTRFLQALQGSLNSESSNPSPTGIAILAMGRVLRTRAAASPRPSAGAAACGAGAPRAPAKSPICRTLSGSDPFAILPRPCRATIATSGSASSASSRASSAPTPSGSRARALDRRLLAGDLSLRGRDRARRDAHDRAPTSPSASRSPASSSPTISSPSSACCTRSPTIRFRRRRRRGSRATRPCSIGPST